MFKGTEFFHLFGQFVKCLVYSLQQKWLFQVYKRYKIREIIKNNKLKVANIQKVI